MGLVVASYCACPIVIHNCVIDYCFWISSLPDKLASWIQDKQRETPILKHWVDFDAEALLLRELQRRITLRIRRNICNKAKADRMEPSPDIKFERICSAISSLSSIRQ